MSKKVLCMIVLIVVLFVVVGIIQVIKSHKKAEISQGEVPVQSIEENQVEELPQNTEENQVDEPVQSAEEGKKVLYFLRNCFVGYLQNNEWKAPTDVLLKDIFDNDHYTVYKNRNEKIISNKLELEFEGVDCFFRYEGLKDSGDKELATYGTKIDGGGYVFDLPNALNERLNAKHTVSLPIGLKTVMLQVDSTESDTNLRRNNFIAFNADYNLKFAKETEIKSLPQDIEKTLREWLDSNGLNPDSNYHIMQFFNVDLNNDGKLDEVYNITSDAFYVTKYEELEKRDYGFEDRIKQSIKKNGGFSVIIIKINDKISFCDSYFISIERASKYNGNFLGLAEFFYIDVVDLNEDGIYEILDRTSFGFYYLVVYDKDSYSLLEPTDY